MSKQARTNPHTIILGGGLAGITAAWQLHRLGKSFTLYEATGRLGGTLHTIHRDGFIIELGPDGWVTEKPWARALAVELGLEDQLVPSLDQGRVTYIVRNGALVAMPDGMRMMVPTNLAALDSSPLFSAEARAAYAAEPGRAAELRASAPAADESIASFVLRHFGHEVLTTIAEPLLAGVFGGSVFELSVRAVMPQFVAMERTHGSLITALQSRPPATASIFTSLAGGISTLIDRMAAELPPASIVLQKPVSHILGDGGGWLVPVDGRYDPCDHLILALPAHAARPFLSPAAADLLPSQASSAVLVALAFDEHLPLPPGFGFLVPPGGTSPLLAATFVDQKFPSRAPTGKRLLRAFFGGPSALTLSTMNDDALATLAHAKLQKLLGPLPKPSFAVTQRWPLSLPQYEVGHLERVAAFRQALPRDLHMIGNALGGVGIPDVIREARAVAHHIAGQPY